MIEYGGVQFFSDVQCTVTYTVRVYIGNTEGLLSGAIGSRDIGLYGAYGAEQCYSTFKTRDVIHPK